MRWPSRRAGAVELGVVAVAQQRPGKHRDGLDLALAAPLDAAGDGGVGALAEEDHAVGAGRGLDGAKERGQPLGERALEVALRGGGERRCDLGENPLLLALEQRLEQLVLRRVAGVDHGLRDPNGPRQRIHGRALVAVLEEQLEGGVEHHRAPPLGAEVGGPRGRAPGLDGGFTHGRHRNPTYGSVFLPEVGNCPSRRHSDRYRGRRPRPRPRAAEPPGRGRSPRRRPRQHRRRPARRARRRRHRRAARRGDVRPRGAPVDPRRDLPPHGRAPRCREGQGHRRRPSLEDHRQARRRRGHLRGHAQGRPGERLHTSPPPTRA